MGTSKPNYKSTYNLLRGLRGLIRSTVLLGVPSTLNLQVGHRHAETDARAPDNPQAVPEPGQKLKALTPKP